MAVPFAAGMMMAVPQLEQRLLRAIALRKFWKTLRNSGKGSRCEVPQDQAHGSPSKVEGDACPTCVMIHVRNDCSAVDRLHDALQASIMVIVNARLEGPGHRAPGV